MNTVQVRSEIAKLKKVIVHSPGPELELMTPEATDELLYDDILNLQNARDQHDQMSGVLAKVARPFQVTDLLQDIFKNDNIRQELVTEVCHKLKVPEYIEELLKLSPKKLTKRLLMGSELKRNTLERYLSSNQFALPPLPNLFFTRDAAMVVNRHVLIGNMATSVRTMEAILMSYIFSYHPELDCEGRLVDTSEMYMPDATFEGGDILILREDVLAVGMSERTSPRGIDYLVEHFKREGKIKNIFVVMLPKHRAMIHLDMVFTMIDYDKAVVFPEMISEGSAVDVVHIDISKPDAPRFSRHEYLLRALRQVDIKLEPIYCGGSDPLTQKREQWQSGANFFTIAPGRVMGYGLNYRTFEELEKAGIPRVEADDVLSGKVDLNKMEKYAVAIRGNELTRGGGGCRCMTMPILREDTAD